MAYKTAAALSGANGAQAVKNGMINKLAEDDKAAHRWYRFVLSYPPHLVRQYLEEFGISKKQKILDPFCGTGTTLVECKKHGIPGVGMEANKMAFFASCVKVDWEINPKSLMRHADKVAGATLDALSDDGINDEVLFFSNGKNTLKKKLKDLPADSKKLLLKNSLSPLPMHKTLILLENLNRFNGSRFFAHERLALAKALVFSISNLHFGPEVGVRSPKEDAAVIAPWLDAIHEMSEDVNELSSVGSATTDLFFADARDITRHVAPHSIDAVITSPPYPNEKDYTRTTRLESVLLGFLQNRAELRSMKHELIRSNTRNVYKGDEDDGWVEDNKQIQRIAQEIESRRIALGKTSGFERLYAKVTKLYFGGMARHLSQLREVLRPGAQLAYVVGDQASYLQVMIRTGKILAEIAESLGYEVIRIDLFRTRLSTATKKMLREEVVVLRWPGGGGTTGSSNRK